MTIIFRRDGVTYRVSTEVGEGRLTDVVVQEDDKAEVPMEAVES